ncbi:MAG TPA: hypothetical protein PKO15_07025 [Fibrobacteria bacterium]|nr:hypothetical protein [Fibrobacteria bacterium]HOX52817.1 hypothetical protein [Fibrobacteria bacterium]
MKINIIDPSVRGLALALAALVTVSVAAQPELEKVRLARQADRTDFASVPDLEVGKARGLAALREFRAEDVELSVADQKQAVVGQPMKEYMVRLDALKSFSEGADADSLLVETGNVHVPVLAGGAAKATVCLAKGAEGWELVSLGEKRKANLREGAVGLSKRRLLKKAQDHFLVRIPAMNLEFVGTYQHKQLLLSPIADDSQTGLKAGDILPAEEIFLKLVPQAQKHEGLPG